MKAMPTQHVFDNVTGEIHACEWSPEMNLLLACARTQLRPIDIERIEMCSKARIDWQIFQQLVFRHRIVPLVWQSLGCIDSLTIPQDTQEALREEVDGNTLHALMQAEELVQLLHRFKDAGIRVMPLKGPTLAMKAYGDLGLRHAGDIDLLIDPASVWDADRILTESGYMQTVPGFPLRGGQIKAFMILRKDFTYTHQERGFHIELHWRWSQNTHLCPIHFEDVWARREEIKVGGCNVAAMPLEDLVLYLCAHGAHTGWFRLKWLCDLPELISQLDMSQLVSRAHDLGMSRMLSQGLVLAHRWLDMPLSDTKTGVLHEDRTVQHLVRFAEHALTADEQCWSPDETPLSAVPTQLRYRFKLRADLRYKRHNVFVYSLWTDDWQWVHLPIGWAWLYIVLRPFLGVIRRLRPHPKLSLQNHQAP